MQYFNNILVSLQKENYKRFYLAVMRIVLSLFLLKEIIWRHSVWELLYSSKTSLLFLQHSAFTVYHINVNIFKDHYLVVIYTYILLLLLMLFGIGKRLTIIAVFAVLFLLQKINNSEVNGGDLLIRFILFYFIFTNSFQYFCVKKTVTTSPFENVVSNLGAYSIMIQLCVTYAAAAYYKAVDSYWADGSAMYYIFNLDAFAHTSYNKLLSKQTWLMYFIAYYTIIIEAIFPILVWFKKYRNLMLWAGLALHLGIYFFMTLYNLQITFLSIYGLFFTTSEWLSFCKKRLPFLNVT